MQPRVKWGNLHVDEVHFRDTAHGLLAWGVASLVTAVLLGGVAKGILGGVVEAGADVAAPVATAYMGNMDKDSNNSVTSPMSYYADMLLRTDENLTESNADPLQNEVNKIFLADISTGKLSAEDRIYLAKIVSKRTGLNQAEALNRVDGVYANLLNKLEATKEATKVAADKARKAAANSALWMFVALLIGAFVASLSATFGGRKRDNAQMLPRNQL